MAKGIDMLAYEQAKLNDVYCYEFPADWDTYGKRAGYLRNEEMVKIADGCLILHDGVSRGTLHTVSLCEKKGIPLKVIVIE